MSHLFLILFVITIQKSIMVRPTVLQGHDIFELSLIMEMVVKGLIDHNIYLCMYMYKRKKYNLDAT